MESVWVRVYFPDTNQGLIYGWKHCPTPANLQHISGTPPAILDFLLLYPPFRCEDHLIIWFMVGESTKKPKNRRIKKISHLKNSAPSWDWDFGIGFLGHGSLRLLRIFPSLQTSKWETLLRRFLGTHQIQVDIYAVMYITPQKHPTIARTHAQTQTHVHLHTSIFSAENFGDFAMFCSQRITTYFRATESPNSTVSFTRSKQDSVTVPAMGK